MWSADSGRLLSSQLSDLVTHHLLALHLYTHLFLYIFLYPYSPLTSIIGRIFYRTRRKIVVEHLLCLNFFLSFFKSKVTIHLYIFYVIYQVYSSINCGLYKSYLDDKYEKIKCNREINNGKNLRKPTKIEK